MKMQKLIAVRFFFAVLIFFSGAVQAKIYPCSMIANNDINFPIPGGDFECADFEVRAPQYFNGDGKAYSSQGAAAAEILKANVPPFSKIVSGAPLPSPVKTYRWDLLGSEFLERYEFQLCDNFGNNCVTQSYPTVTVGYPQICPPGFTVPLSPQERQLVNTGIINYGPIAPSPTNGYPCYRKIIVEIDRTRRPPPSCSKEGNPIYPLMGSKYEVIGTGFSIAGQEISLTYDSRHKIPVSGSTQLEKSVPFSALGMLWTHSLQKSIFSIGNPTSKKDLIAIRGDGNLINYQITSIDRNRAVLTPRDELKKITTGWLYYDEATKSVETYDVGGVLQSISYSSGDKVNLQYSTTSTLPAISPLPGQLIQARDNRGRIIDFRYILIDPASPSKGAKLSQMIYSGLTISFGYDSKGNLEKIQWPDGKNRTFLYERSDLDWALTGVVDENLSRFSTFGYDTNGLATSTEHAGGTNKYSVSYATPPSRIFISEQNSPYENVIYRYFDWKAPTGTLVNSPLGQPSTWSATVVHGNIHPSSRSQPAGAGCAASTKKETYDYAGQVTAREDFNGKKTCYSYSEGGEAVRVEGLEPATLCSSVLGSSTLPAGSRKISTDRWDSALNHQWLGTVYREAAPGSRVTYVYNGDWDPFTSTTASCAPASATYSDGKPLTLLCKKVEQATTDLDGARGFSAMLDNTLPSRITTWTYGSDGQVLTEDGPRTDVSDVTTYTYHAATAFTGTDPYAVGVTLGDLKSITNAAGTTQYTKYNKHGQLLESIDPNGVVSSYTYDLRQRMLSSTVGGQQTTYAYDPAGQLKKVTRPDTSWTGYDYDPAHRLVAVYDNLGNRVDYTLDNAGNRTAENIKDPGGVLKRQLARSIDPLGRVQQTTGRE